MTLVAFDFETVSTPPSQEEVAEWELNWEAPKNWKDSEKILSKMEDDKQKWLEKRGLNLQTARVFSAAAVQFDVRPFRMLTNFSYCSDSESEVIGKLAEYIPYAPNLKLVTFGGNTFDNLLLIRGMHRAQIDMPKPLTRYQVVDLFEYPLRRDGGLKHWAKVFGIERESEVVGHQVQALYDSGEWDLIREYNLDDAIVTAKLYSVLNALYEI